MLKEFKEFATRGNIMDLAVGVVMGGSFQKIVTSLVQDIIMPAVSVLTGKVDFSDMAITIGDSTIKYGNFITAIVDFLIISFSIFIMVRYLNKWNKIKELGEMAATKLDKNGKIIKVKQKKQQEPEPVKEPETKVCPYCLTEIKYHATRCPNCTSELEQIVENVVKVENTLEESKGDIEEAK